MTTTISVPGGTFSAYVAEPKNLKPGQKRPGMLVIQEIFGVNAVMRAVCDEWAGRGYIALCPDLFWRQEPNIDITDQSQAEWQKAFALYQGFDEAKGVEDLKAALAHLRRLPSGNGRAGTLGFCLGGKLAYLVATRADADCNVSYYGVGIDKALDESPRIAKPLLMHIAEKDRFVPPEAQAQIKSRLGGNAHIALHVYPGVDHAFARKGGEHWNAAAADLAARRTNDFIALHLPS